VNQPYGIAEDASGVYVANTYANTVLKLSKANGTVMWTATGCGGVSFGRPRDVAVGSDGNVYVADTDRNRIVRLNPTTGACAGSPPTFGSTGTANGQFRAPRALTSDGSGGLWVTEGTGNRLQHVTNTGAFLGTIGSFGEATGQFRSAHCVFMDGNLVAVCDTFNYRIQRFSVNASGVPSFHSLIGGTRPANGGFNGAFDVAYGPDGSIYVTDWFNHRIQKFTAGGVFVDDWGGYGTPNGSFIFPRGIAVKGDGTVVVTDSENNRIDLLQPNGTFIRSFKPQGDTFLRPHATAVASDGSYWVADTGKNRLVQLTDNGNGTATITRTIANVTAPRGVAVDASGNVYASTQGNVIKVTPGGVRTTLANTGGGNTQVRSPYGLRIVGSGSSAQLLIADRGNNRVLVLTLSGQYVTQFGAAGSGNGQLAFPQGVDRHPTTGQIAVADFANDRVSVWAPS
jgi:sugar lactone lactonase YvrE